MASFGVRSAGRCWLAVWAVSDVCPVPVPMAIAAPWLTMPASASSNEIKVCAIGSNDDSQNQSGRRIPSPASSAARDGLRVRTESTYGPASVQEATRDGEAQT